MLDYWVGGGCSSMNFCRQQPDERMLQRMAFMRRHAGRDMLTHPDMLIHPFVHPPWENGGPSDPLVKPIVAHLNTIEGVETFASCQGSDRTSPYIMFTAEREAALAVLKISYEWDRHEGWYWNNTILAIDGVRDGRMSWSLQFYDTIALIKFNKDYLGMSVHDQFHIDYPHPWPMHGIRLVSDEVIAEVDKMIGEWAGGEEPEYWRQYKLMQEDKCDKEAKAQSRQRR